MSQAARRVVRHTGNLVYVGDEIQYSYWSHIEEGQVPDTIVFLGTGQTGRIADWAARAAGLGVVVVEGAPHWRAHPSGKDLYDFMQAYTSAAFEMVTEQFSMNTANLIAQSQAAPGVVRLANAFSARIGGVALIAPLGFVGNSLGATPEMRLRALRSRARRTLLQTAQSPFHDPRNLYAGYTILRAILLEPEKGASSRKYATGLSYSMVDDFRRLLQQQDERHKTLAVLLGEHDRVFSPQDIRPVLKAAGIRDSVIHIVSGASHSSLGVRAGRRMLNMAITVVRQGQWSGRVGQA